MFAQMPTVRGAECLAGEDLRFPLRSIVRRGSLYSRSKTALKHFSLSALNLMTEHEVLVAGLRQEQALSSCDEEDGRTESSEVSQRPQLMEKTQEQTASAEVVWV